MTSDRVVQCADITGGRVALTVASAACWLAVCHGALALNVCAGTYSGSAIHPYRPPIVIRFQPETNDQPTELGNGFIAGLQHGGIVTTGQPTTRLNIASVITLPRTGSGQPQRYHGAWAEDSSASAEFVVSSTLQLSVTLTDIKTSDIFWIATLSCKVLTNDKERVVETIGELLGRAVGKDVEPTRF